MEDNRYIMDARSELDTRLHRASERCKNIAHDEENWAEYESADDYRTMAWEIDDARKWALESLQQQIRLI